MSPVQSMNPDSAEGPLVKRARKSYPDNNRSVSLFSVSARHPLNVKPGGNSLLANSIDFKPSKSQQMGDFERFPEELLMELFSYIQDPKSLMRLSHTSRIMYAYLYDEEIWRKLNTHKVLEGERTNQQSETLPWKGSWRCTLLRLEESKEAKLQLKDNLLCSDTLYRPFQCSKVDYSTLFSKIIKEESVYHQDSLNGDFDHTLLPNGRIARLAESQLTLNDFNENWSNKPFILTNENENRWPVWTLNQLLERFPEVKFRQEVVQWPLKLYSEYLANNKDESPLYLFDCNSMAMKSLKQEYAPPKIFQPDFFKTFNHFSNKPCRPDYAWLIIGPKRSGSTFHKDPNSTSAWNAAISGRKLWVMLPPGTTPPGVGTDEEESEVTSPVGIAEWVISGFFNDSLKIESCQIGITFPGECMYVPAGWWHSVINLDDSIALTQNFVPQSQLCKVLNFLKNKHGQISGFKPKNVKLVMDEILKSDKDINNETLSKLKEYSSIFESLDPHLQEEDCGEITSEKLPPMPIFELFSQLMILGDNKQELEAGLEKLVKLEKNELMKKTGKSEMWTKLTDEKQESVGFSFGFGFDESDDE